MPHALHLTAEAVASLPPPGLSGPSHVVFSPSCPDNNISSGRYLAYVHTGMGRSKSSKKGPPQALYRPLVAPSVPANSSNSNNNSSTGSTTPTTSGSTERVLLCLDLTEQQQQASPSMTTPLQPQPHPLLRLGQQGSGRTSSKRRLLLSDQSTGDTNMSLEERLRRERMRLSSSSSSLTQFSWTWFIQQDRPTTLRLLIPARGSLYIQDGVVGATATKPVEDIFLMQPSSSTSTATTTKEEARCLYDKSSGGGVAMDPQLSPDGTLCAWTVNGVLYAKATDATAQDPAIRLSFGTTSDGDTPNTVSYGVADFVAQEEMDRYRGFWWHPDSSGILLTRIDESKVPLYRIQHPETSSSSSSSASATADAGSGEHQSYEDHRYPFAGKENPSVQLGYLELDRASLLGEISRSPPSTSSQQQVRQQDHEQRQDVDDSDDPPDAVMSDVTAAQEIAQERWNALQWWDPPREAGEYLARVHWLPDGSAVAQWQNRSQTTAVWMRMDIERHKARTLLVERSEVWINLHHMFKVLPRAIHPDECVGVERNIPPIPNPLPPNSFSFLYASERTGFLHLYLYTFCPGINGEQAIMLRAVSAGEWMVENIVGVDMDKDVVYFTGTYDSVLERHLYALPITNSRLDSNMDEDHCHSSSSDDSSSNPKGVRRGFSKVIHALSGKGGRGRDHEANAAAMNPVRLTVDSGMHTIVMDDDCRMFADTSSDLDRPTVVKVYALPQDGSLFMGTNGSTTLRQSLRLITTLYDAMREDKSLIELRNQTPINGMNPSSDLCVVPSLPAPEMLTFPTTDGTGTLHAALYRPDPRVHGPGPYPLVCAVYGGPHVQRVNRSWSQCADMRAQRLRNLGFCVVKCDNRGSSRRGIAFESAISRRLGRLEVLDQVAAVRHLTVRGIADPSRVGIYGWSYGGYLAAMCLCRAPDVFHVAVAGAPVTSWDGYDTHYTERYMGLPADNPAGYRESAIFDHVPNMQGKLMIVHGLIDENVHFRHTARLINKLIAAGKDYDLLIFPDERHSPRRLRDRIYMEQRISNYFLKHLGPGSVNALDLVTSLQGRNLAGHL